MWFLKIVGSTPHGQDSSDPPICKRSEDENLGDFEFPGLREGDGGLSELFFTIAEVKQVHGMDDDKFLALLTGFAGDLHDASDVCGNNDLRPGREDVL